MCLLCVTETYQYSGSVLTHVGISLTFRNYIRIKVVITIYIAVINAGAKVRAAVHSFTYISLFQKFCQRLGTIEKLDFWVRCPEEKTTGI